VAYAEVHGEDIEADFQYEREATNQRGHRTA
jgi:hypothetical protein